MISQFKCMSHGELLGLKCHALHSRISFLLNAHHLLQDVGIYLLVNSLNTTKLKKLCEIILQWLRKDNDM